MKKNIIKIISIFCILMIVATITYSVKALSIVMTEEAQEAERQAKNTVTGFLKYLEYGSSSTYYYIDSSNVELYNELRDRLNSYSSIDFDLKRISKDGDVYNIDGRIATKSGGTTVDGFTANFKVKKINGTYKIIDTNFFEITSAEYVTGFALGIIGIVFLVLGIIFVIVVTVIIVVVVIVVNKNKKK